MQEFGMQIEWTMTRTKSDNNIQKKRTLHLVLRMRGEMQLTNETIPLDVETSDTNDNVKNQDPEKHQREAQHEHVNVRVVVVVFLVLVLSLLSHSFPCTHRLAQDVRVFVSSHPCMK